MNLHTLVSQNYAPGTLFNPEKYVTRAEAAEIAYRMTQTEQALAFHNTLFKTTSRK